MGLGVQRSLAQIFDDLHENLGAEDAGCVDIICFDSDGDGEAAGVEQLLSEWQYSATDGGVLEAGSHQMERRLGGRAMLNRIFYLGWAE